MKTNENKVIYSNTIGHRTIMGTRWGVENVVTRRVKWGKPYWNVAFSLCNGFCTNSKNYNTKKAAIEAAS